MSNYNYDLSFRWSPTGRRTSTNNEKIIEENEVNPMNQAPYGFEIDNQSNTEEKPTFQLSRDVFELEAEPPRRLYYPVMTTKVENMRKENKGIKIYKSDEEAKNDTDRPTTTFNPRRNKRNPGCMRQCLLLRLLHPSQCHFIC